MKFFLLFFLLPQIVMGQSAPSSADLQTWAHSAEWKRLLYMDSSLFGGEKSRVDGKSFFLSPTGATDPEAELKATISAFEKKEGEFGKLKQPIGCAYPARKRFLEKMGLHFPDVSCLKWKEFIERLDPVGISLVYATAYANNPASMFGHSFLKIKSGKNKSGQIDLLDWSLNYAAVVPPDENGFSFAWFGIMGGYPGQFSTVPYYAKIQEYGYLESRDIWEYELNFTQDELIRLLEFAWEIETNTYFDYFFFDENCSYQILVLLENAKPQWDLSKYFLHMIPGDAVKRVARTPGAVLQVKMRASLERKLIASAKSFSSAQKSEWKKMLQGEKIENISTPVLDAYILYLQAEKQKKQEKWNQEARLHEALVRRALSKFPSQVLNYGGENTRPDIGHGSYQVTLGAAFGKKSAAELGVHFAYHDLLDSDQGYVPNAEVLFPNFRLRFYNDKKFKLEEVNFFSLVSLTPWSLIRKPLAWRASASYQRMRYPKCDRCMGWLANGGAGAAFDLGSGAWTLWAILDAKAEWTNGPKFFVGPEWGNLWRWKNSKLEVVARRYWGKSNHWQLEGGISQALSQNFSLRGNFEWNWRENSTLREAKILAVHYF